LLICSYSRNNKVICSRAPNSSSTDTSHASGSKTSGSCNTCIRNVFISCTLCVIKCENSFIYNWSRESPSTYISECIWSSSALRCSPISCSCSSLYCCPICCTSLVTSCNCVRYISRHRSNKKSDSL
jgi:hypothetical protein